MAVGDFGFFGDRSYPESDLLIPPTCPVGQSWNGNQCVCPTGQEWNGTKCVLPEPDLDHCGLPIPNWFTTWQWGCDPVPGGYKCSDVGYGSIVFYVCP